MKLSKFNISIQIEDKILYHNTLSKEYLLLEPMLHDLIVAAGHEDNVEGLANYHPDLHAKLMQSGFVVSEEKDEIQAVRELMHQIDHDDSNYRITINPTMNCNFKCWYCYESHIKDSKMSQETITAVCNHVDYVIENNKNLKQLRISWFGGEPLLYFDRVVVPIISYAQKTADAHDIKFVSGFTTNGYLINEKKIQLCKDNGVKSFQITLDGDQKLHDSVRFISNKKGSYNEIVNNIKLLAKHGFSVVLRINYTKATLNTVESVLASFDDMETGYKKNIILSLKKVWQADVQGSESQVAELYRISQKLGFSKVDPVYGDTVQNSCYADKKNHATINYNGEVYKCTARDFTSETKEGLLQEDGSIQWNDKYQNRLEAKLKNKPCLECPILPICGGGCSQAALENEGKDYCVHNFDENKKKQLVLNNFLNSNAVYQKAMVDV